MKAWKLNHLAGVFCCDHWAIVPNGRQMVSHWESLLARQGPFFLDLDGFVYVVSTKSSIVQFLRRLSSHFPTRTMFSSHFRPTFLLRSLSMLTQYSLKGALQEKEKKKEKTMLRMQTINTEAFPHRWQTQKLQKHQSRPE